MIMDLITKIKMRAQNKKMRIVLPESMDKRILEAAKIASKENLAEIILIGEKDKLLKENDGLEDIKIIDPKESDLTDRYIQELVNLRKNKNMTEEEAKKLLLEDYMYYACMLVHDKQADGVVSGACHSTANTLRPALQIIKTSPDVSLVSAFFLMVVPNCKYGENGTFVFADSGLEQNPTSEKLAEIAASSAKSFQLLVEKEPLVAFLSHSTKGSAKHSDVDKVVEAVKLAKEKYKEFKMDGELQLDAAIVPEIAESKAPGSEVAGKANVLIFPDLDAGNIGYKLVQRLGNAESYGPITQGIAAPINDLSRGCSVEDIVGVIAITAVQAQNSSK